jgi:hypothetical protein
LYLSLSRAKQRDAVSLIQAILEVDELSPIIPHGSLSDEAKRQLNAEIKEIWIISDLLGENIYDELFEATYNNILKRNISYV